MELGREISGREMERFAVTAATGALGPVLKKLTALLGDDEYELQEETRRDIRSIRSQLEPVHDLLAKIWGREDLDAVCKHWMAEARELSYDMEDDINHFTTLGLETMDDSPFKEFMERVKGVSERCGEMQKMIGDDARSICNRSKQLSTDPRALFLHKDATELVGMGEKKEELIELLQEHQMVCIVGFAGMGKTTLADLVYQTIGDGFQCRAFVSIHPSPNMVEILGAILSQVTDHGATISAGRSSTDDEPAAEENIINDILISLIDKRYLIIIDDVWHWGQWEVIQKALPKNNRGCKIIMTTRIMTTAWKCQSELGAYVYRQWFSKEDAISLSDLVLRNIKFRGLKPYNKIVGMCGQMPLAVICFTLSWAERKPASYGEWERHVLDGFLSIPSLKPLVLSLCLGFDDLPVQQRTCFLYCSIFPPRYRIKRDCLVRQWIAEGFVSQKEVAEDYFDKLLSRNLLEPIDVNTYMVHQVMRTFLVCKAKEDNFVAYGQGNNGSWHAKHQKIRRLSLCTADRFPEEDDLYLTRCLAAVGMEEYHLVDVSFKMFKNLQVLEISNSQGIDKGHLVDVCGLILLRCLRLHYNPEITELPREIGRLQNLEILDVSWTRITEIPKEIGQVQHLRALYMAGTQITELPREIWNLQHLEALDISETKVTELPTEIQKLRYLNALNVSGTNVTELPREITGHSRLEHLDVSRTGVRELPKEFRKLQDLRSLDIRCTKVRELSCREIPNSFLCVVGHFDHASRQVVKFPLGVLRDDDEGVIISSSSGANCSSREGRRLSILVLFNHFGGSCQVLPVPMHRVAGRHMNLPQWVKRDLSNVSSLHIRLCKLDDDDLEFLKQMPNLQALELGFDQVPPREPIAITGRGFSKLETFYVDCRLPRVITFEEGAMPELRHLEFKFYTGAASHQAPLWSMGIMHLPCLEKVVFRCSEHYTRDSPGISATVDVVRKEAAQHPNEINLWVNDDMLPEVFGSGATWLSLADKAFIEKETENMRRELKERAETNREQRRLLSTAADERRQQQQDKNNAAERAAAIQKEIEERKKHIHDMVEPMLYLYVNVVKARNLSIMGDVAGVLDPFVEVKLGNFKCVTRYHEKNSNPVWRQTFAFSSEQQQYSSGLLEVVVKDKDIIKDSLVGWVLFDMDDIPRRVRPDCPLPLEWYRLANYSGDKQLCCGEIMLAVWFATQADKAFSVAWHSDAHSLSNTTSSKEYI